jgi:signal transduction histidine kinase
MAIYIQIALENASAYREIADKSKILRVANNSIRNQKDLIEEKNKELLALDHEKNHLIGIVAHDLRNPLAIAISLTDFIKQDIKNLSLEQQEGLNITNRSLIRMNEMIKRILDVKAVEAKKVNLHLESVNTSKVWEQVVQNFEENIEKKQLELQFHKPEFPAVCKLDHNYTIQIFENLLSNAIKFSPNGKSISIFMTENDGYLRMMVSDQGPGIHAEDFGKLFGKYQRLSARPTGGETSTGLGLSIVKKYVEVMKGKVWCESEFGGGATFIVEFELEKVMVS